MMAERDPIETLTGEREEVQATAAEKAAVAKSANPRRKVMLGLAGAMLLAGGGWYMLHDSGHVSTDNAYVNADSAQVTPLVSAAVVAVPVVNTQVVRRGDVLLRLDDSDARLAVEKAEAAYLKARREYNQSSATSGSLAAQVGARQADIGQSQAQLAAAQSAFEKAKVDLDGKEYIDGVSSLWCNVHGHRVSELDEAIRNQMDHVAHSTLLGMANVPSILLARRLVELAPDGLNHVFFSDDGATAVEVALKMAFQYWRQCRDPRPSKTQFLALGGAYHGDTLGDVSVGDLASGGHASGPGNAANQFELYTSKVPNWRSLWSSYRTNAPRPGPSRARPVHLR